MICRTRRTTAVRTPAGRCSPIYDRFRSARSRQGGGEGGWQPVRQGGRRTDRQGQAAVTVMAASLRRLPAKYRRACLLSHPPCKWRADGNSQTDTWIFSGSSRCGDDHRRGLLFNGCSALICRHETQKNLHSACAEYCHGRRFWRNLLCRARWKRYCGGISRCAMGFDGVRADQGATR